MDESKVEIIFKAHDLHKCGLTEQNKNIWLEYQDLIHEWITNKEVTIEEFEHVLSNYENIKRDKLIETITNG